MLGVEEMEATVPFLPVDNTTANLRAMVTAAAADKATSP
jgi:hypothetical protein